MADVDRLYLLLQLQREIKNGSSDGTRTCDILINSQTLYQLSYRGICCGNYLLSHVVSNEVPLAFGRLTTVFGMGTGGTVRASSPHLLECYSLKTRQKKLFCKLVAKYPVICVLIQPTKLHSERPRAFLGNPFVSKEVGQHSLCAHAADGTFYRFCAHPKDAATPVHVAKPSTD